MGVFAKIRAAWRWVVHLPGKLRKVADDLNKDGDGRINALQPKDGDA